MYQKRFIKFSILLAILAIATMGCKKEDLNKNMQTVVLKGIVNDISGKPLNGVKVTTGTATATTDSKGGFSFNQAEVIDKRAVIKFEKSGYFTLTRSRVKENDMFIDAVLCPKGNSEISVQTTFNASEGKTLEVKGMKVKLSASSIVRANGSAYSGTVNANMLYLDPNNANFSGLMPGGDLAAIRENGSECMLISYGMTNVVLTDNSGNPLQLKSGAQATLTFPIPAGMENGAPATMPLWHFDESKGIWIEDGVATLKDGVYVGTVTHFSWKNLDVPAQRVTLKGKVVDCENKPVSNEKVKVGQTASYTNSKGEWMTLIPENTPVTVSVTANGGSDSKDIPGYSGGTTQNVSDLKVPCGVILKGKVIDCENKPVFLAFVKAGQTSVYTNSNGEYSMKILENTPVTVSVTANGGSDSKDLPGYSGGTTQIVPDLKVPCGDNPENYIEIPKGCIVYEYYTSSIYHFPWCDSLTPVESVDIFREYYIFTFDNYGRRARVDWINSQGNISYTRIWNDLVNKEYRSGNWIDNCTLFWNECTDDNIMFNYAPYISMGVNFRIDTWPIPESDRFIADISTTTIADKLLSITTYRMKPEAFGYDRHYYWKFGYWKGVLMYFRGTNSAPSQQGLDSDIKIRQINARKIETTINIPLTAFDDPTLPVTSWITVP